MKGLFVARWIKFKVEKYADFFIITQIRFIAKFIRIFRFLLITKPEMMDDCEIILWHLTLLKYCQT